MVVGYKMFIRILVKISSIFDAIQNKIVPKSDVLERILVGMLVKDFNPYYNP